MRWKWLSHVMAVLDTAIQVFFVPFQRVALDGRIKSGPGVTM